MRKQHSGRIVNLASVAGHVTLAFGAWYSATKYAQEKKRPRRIAVADYLPKAESRVLSAPAYCAAVLA